MECDGLKAEAVLSEWMVKEGWLVGRDLLLLDDLDGGAICELLAVPCERFVVQHSLSNRKQLVKQTELLHYPHSMCSKNETRANIDNDVVPSFQNDKVDVG